MNTHEYRLAELLEDNPRMQQMQHMIDLRLARCSSSTERMVMLNSMMHKALFKLAFYLNNGVPYTPQAEVIKLELLEK